MYLCKGGTRDFFKKKTTKNLGTCLNYHYNNKALYQYLRPLKNNGVCSDPWSGIPDTEDNSTIPRKSSLMKLSREEKTLQL